mmetsp:Transcript_12891/g.25199  ORF Transcript_12891/g.25199 Transcript_12891/m.25199 type:complete len:102 (-) Transcript_12891:22-327(-)
MKINKCSICILPSSFFTSRPPHLRKFHLSVCIHSIQNAPMHSVVFGNGLRVVLVKGKRWKGIIRKTAGHQSGLGKEIRIRKHSFLLLQIAMFLLPSCLICV